MFGNEGKRGKMIKGLGALFFLLIFTGIGFAAHPLITDDTGTQGRGKFQAELNWEFNHEDAGGVEESLHQLQTAFAFGIIDSVDFIVTVPYLWITTEEGGIKTKADGLSDITAELKWRFFEREGFSLAVKPGLSIPSGDEEEGLGAGKVGGSFFFIATQELEPFTFHFNAGYGRNETTADEERTDIWHVSLATEYEAFKWLKLVANVGAERNPDTADDTPAAFILGGFIVPVTESLEFSVGAKGGLTGPETDYGLLAGVTFRF
ncbi:MAG: transporter [Syntrophobacteraceae bacterium]